MNFNIRKYFSPVQPSVKSDDQFVSYCEILPDERLCGYIYCYWFLKTDVQMENVYKYNVVADGCIDIVFDLTNPCQSFVMGFCDRSNQFEIDNSFNAVGIRFLPAIFPTLFNFDALEFSNNLVPLNLFLKSTSQFIEENFSCATSNKSIKNILDNYFLKILNNNPLKIDPRFLEALHVILSNNGVINMNSDLDIGLSHRQLRRYFDLYVGSSPKAFSQVVRFQNILNARLSLQNLKDNKLFYDFGYYDQAHFINDFKRYYGLSPSNSLQ